MNDKTIDELKLLVDQLILRVNYLEVSVAQLRCTIPNYYHPQPPGWECPPWRQPTPIWCSS